MSIDIAAAAAGDFAPSHTLPRGTMVRDFRIDEVLGEGGFGIVYLATDAALQRQVAVKEYLPSSMAARAGDGKTVVIKSEPFAETFALGLKSFVNEAQLLARFNHPALVKVHQFWEEHGTAYMVMPFYEGPTLRRVLAELGRPPTEDEINRWLRPLLDALEVLHKDQCYHRDIAPDNILITTSGPMLLDFGAARRVIGDLTHALTAVLKPGYAPIEQYGDIPDMSQGPWTDIFALGSVLYGAIAGVRPVPSVERLIADRMKPLTELAAGRLRPGFLAAVDQAMALRPEHRPRDVAEFRNLLWGQVLVPEVTALSPAVPLAATRIAPQRAPVTLIPAPPPSSNPHNLPRQRTSFVGRETELRDIQLLLDQTPLVTLLGMGGLGKTRLAQQVAAELLPRFADGAWFVDLSVVSDPALLVSAVAHTLGVFDEPGRPLMDTVCAWLKQRRVLIVMDNCEHLVAPAAELVDAILTSAPLVQVLATSRELLDVPGEQAYPILPLATPARDAGATIVLQSASVRMFVDRARAQQPGFLAQDHEASLLADLVARLEGIPLAIELAAARLRSMSVSEILAGLEDRYQLLAGGSRLLQRRQQTLRALVDWSYDMLTADERQVFVRLALFAGGLDAVAARAVCADEALPAARVNDLLASLVQKSLLSRDSETPGSRDRGGGVARYRMLETLREYAREKLLEMDPQGAAAARHIAHYFALAKEAARGMHGAEQGRWVRRLELELENLRAAGASALATDQALLAVKLAVALTGFWILRGHVSEGRKLIAAALELPAVQQSDVAKAWALYTNATLAGAQGDHVAALAMFETCLALRRTLGNAIEVAATLSTLALARLQAGDAQAAAQSETEALKLFALANDRLGQAIGCLHLGQIHLWSGEAELALAHLARSLEVAREIGNREVEAESELTVAQVHMLLQQPQVAQAALLRSMKLCQDAGDQRGQANAHGCQGRLALHTGQVAAARDSLQRALRDFRTQDMRDQLLACLDDFSWLLRLENQAELAFEMAVANEQARQRLLLRRSPRDQEQWTDHLSTLRAQLPAATLELLDRRGRAWEVDQAVRTALGEGGSALS